MELYGPLINLWEGANQCEGYLMYAKPIITDINSVNWYLNAHNPGEGCLTQPYPIIFRLKVVIKAQKLL